WQQLASMHVIYKLSDYFFFQAEDGIRDRNVTGVQTCALPICGMIIGKTMTGVSLGVNNLLTGMRDRQANIEGALMLGASPKTASKSIVNEAFDQAMLPTVNAMVGMGIVFLPGMM